MSADFYSTFVIPMMTKNPSPLTIRVKDFDTVAAKPELLKKLRSLTLHPGSGMNHELNSFAKKVANGSPINCKVLLAYLNKEIVAWAILSKEYSDFWFPNGGTFTSTEGTLFQVYVHPDHRRQGIASRLMKTARRKVSGSRLCICPWDTRSDAFYANFEHYNHKKI